MSDHVKSKEELIKELGELRKRTRKLQASDDDVKRIEEALRKIRDFNPSLLNTIGMSIVDFEGTILLTNKEMETIFGKEAIGKKCWELYKDDKKQCTVCSLKKDFKLGETDSIEMTGMFGGKTYQITHTGIKFKDKNAIMEMYQDITESKRYEDVLKIRAMQQEIVADLGQKALSGEELETLIDEATFLVAQGIGVPLVKVLEYLPDQNQYFLRAGVGWKNGSVHHYSFDAEIGSQAKYTLENNEPVLVEDFSNETRFEAPQMLVDHGVISGISVVIQGLYSPFGVLGAHTREKRRFTKDDIYFLQAIANVIATSIDRKRAEEEMIKAQKLESVSILAGGIAHDFNNLLTGILGNVSIVRIDLDDKPGLKERLVDAETATLRARDLTGQLLTFSQGGLPVKETLSIHEIINESISLALSGSNVRCDCSIMDDLMPVEADAGQTRQVFHNLLINAKQSMPDGGVINVSAENIHLESPDHLPLEPGNYVKIIVSDKGHGISEKVLPRIFDPYFTTHELGTQKGRGLGLAITYSVIKEHNGTIDVHSKINEGTTFTLYFPASEHDLPARKVEEEELICGTGRVLVMDDEDLIREVVCDMLERLGYEAEEAADGTAALALYEQAMKARQPFDAVILDVTIPGGMGGKETMQKLLEIDPEVKGIVSSGYANIPALSNYKDFGFYEKMKKPYNIQQLSQILQEVINRNKEEQGE